MAKHLHQDRIEVIRDLQRINAARAAAKVNAAGERKCCGCSETQFKRIFHPPEAFDIDKNTGKPRASCREYYKWLKERRKADRTKAS